MDNPKQHVAVRLAGGLVARIDALVPRLSTRWRDARRSDVLRAVIIAGLEVIEANPAVLDAPKA